jgi:hypothetical protein
MVDQSDTWLAPIHSPRPGAWPRLPRRHGWQSPTFHSPVFAPSVSWAFPRSMWKMRAAENHHRRLRDWPTTAITVYYAGSGDATDVVMAERNKPYPFRSHEQCIRWGGGVWVLQRPQRKPSTAHTSMRQAQVTEICQRASLLQQHVSGLRLPKLRCYTVSFGLRLFFPNQSNPMFKVDEKDTGTVRASFEFAPEVRRDSGLLSSLI